MKPLKLSDGSTYCKIKFLLNQKIMTFGQRKTLIIVCERPSSLYRPKKEKNPCYIGVTTLSVINIVLLCHANVYLSDIVPSSGVLHVMPKELNFSFLPKLRGIKGNTHSVLLHSISFHYLYIFHFSIIYSFHSVINSNEA